MTLAIGAFRPDVVGPGSGFAQTADGVLPKLCTVNGQTNIGYGPAADRVTPSTATALATAPRGSISLTLVDGTWATFFGTDTTISQLQADYTWLDIATGLNVTSGDDISFLHFGSYLLNTNKTDGFKAYNVEAPAGNNAVSGAPAARSLFSCSNVVFALDCGGNNKRLQSSGLGDHTTWTTLGANGKTFEDGGALICGRDLKNGSAVVFQDAAMRLIQFGSAPDGALYSITKISDGVGAVGERSVVAWDGVAYFWTTAGAYRFDIANGVRPIGNEKIDNWFLGQLDLTAFAGIQGAVDPRHKMVWWRWKKLSTVSTTVYDVLLGYNWELGEWVTATTSTAALTRIATPGYTLEQMDAFGVLDSISTPLDDPFWQGGSPVFAGLDSSYKFCTFSGGAMAATLETCITANPVSDEIGRATPVCDSANMTLQLGVSDDRATATTWKTGNSKGRAGAVPLRGRGLNIAFRANIPAAETWTYCNGIDSIQSAQGGAR